MSSYLVVSECITVKLTHLHSIPYCSVKPCNKLAVSYYLRRLVFTFPIIGFICDGDRKYSHVVNFENVVRMNFALVN